MGPPQRRVSLVEERSPGKAGVGLVSALVCLVDLVHLPACIQSGED